MTTTPTTTPLDLDALETKRRALKDCAYFSYAKTYNAFKYELYRQNEALIAAARERDELQRQVWPDMNFVTDLRAQLATITAERDAAIREVDDANRALGAVEAQRDRAVEALDSIEAYGSDTLSGRDPADGPDDREWQRFAVREMRNRARFARAKLNVEIAEIREASK